MRKYHILKPNEGSEFFRRLIFLDSESRVDRELVHHPYLAVARFYSHRSGREPTSHDDTYLSDDETFPALWDAVDDFCHKGKNYLVAHNMFYDLWVLKGIPELTRRGWVVSNYFSRGPVFIMDFKKENKHLIAFSSTNYYAAPLAKLGEIFNVPKLSVDYNADDVPTMVEYCRRDVDILQTAVLAFQRFVLDNDLGVQSRTLAGQAFAAFRHRFMKHEIAIHSNVEVCDLERRSYTGGRVECWYQGTLPENATYYKLDFNSMYPAVMHEECYPTRLIKHGTSLSESDYRYFRNERRYAITAEVDVETPEPCFPKIEHGHLIYPTGSFHTTLSTPELDYGYEHGYIKNVIEYSLYETASIFRDYVDWFYSRKVEEKDEVLRNFYKLFLNSLYGKFGQKMHDISRCSDAPLDKVGVETVLTLADANEQGSEDEIHTYRFFGGSCFEIVELAPGECEAFNSFPAIAAHVTAYARMKLWRSILASGRENVYYMDTDSLFVSEQGLDNLTKAGWIDPDRLGALKVEKESNRVEIRQPKDYTFGADTKRKGVGKGAEQLDETTFADTQWPKLDGMLATKRYDRYQNRRIVKRLSVIYRKGWVLPGGTVEPFAFKNDRFIPKQLPDNITGTINLLYTR